MHPVAAVWALANRARGWGGGKTRVGRWVAKHLLNRYTMALVNAGSMAWHADAAGYSLHEIAAIFASIAPGWWFGVWRGWGDYFDGIIYANHEIEWIDNFMVWLSRYLPKRWATSAPFIDNVSMGLRGAFYLPMLLTLYCITGSPGHLIAIALFWQDGVVYGMWRRISRGRFDFVAVSELSGGALRGQIIAMGF